MGVRINLGSGGNNLSGYDNLDKNTMFGATYLDFDDDLLKQYADSSVEEIICQGCLNEFKTDVVTSMSEFWRVLQPEGILHIIVAVVDNGIGPFRDPIAKRYLSSEWVQYFSIDHPNRLAGGYGLGFKGAFRVVLDEVAGERHEVVAWAIK